MMRGAAGRMARSVLAVLWALMLVGCTDGSTGVQTISIHQLKNIYRGYPVVISSPIAVEGVVVSSDRWGESYRRLAVQDESGGVTFSIENRALHEEYSVGDRIRVECLGLTIGSYGHLVLVGGPPEGDMEVGPLEWSRWQAATTLVGSAAEPKPIQMTIGECNPRYLSVLVRLDGVRFVEAGEPWATEDEAITRHLVDVATTTDTLAVRCSGYSDFYHHRLPAGEVRVVGVLGYFHNAYQLLVDSPDRVSAGEEYH